MKQKNYIGRSLLLVLLVVAGVVGLGFVPVFEVFGFDTERVDIFSSLRAEPSEEAAFEYVADMSRLEEELSQMSAPQDTLPEMPPVSYHLIDEAVAEVLRPALRSEDIRPDTTRRVIPIEVFDTSAYTRVDRFIDKLISGEAVRIAFMGDSFVEGDIITVDMRDELQRLFGGRGVGFVPCDIPYATARKSVKRTSRGWSSYSIMKPKAAPEALRDLFCVSGYISKGGVGASTRWQSLDIYPTLDSCERGRVFLLSRDSSRVELIVNDTLRREVDVAADTRLRELRVDMPVRSLALKILDGSVVCYGASLEGRGGVTLDNFSVRSNNGHAIFGTSASINRQVDDMLGYDLVVLQYGLNIMLPNQRNFSKYRDQLCDMIAYAERSFPNAAILVLGVSDRWIKSEDTGNYQPIGSVDALTSYQRAAADSTHVAFWNTSEAMAEYGGIRGFVSKGWAAGDYTHINYAGGKRIAQSLVAAIRDRAYRALAERERQACEQHDERRRIVEEYHRRADERAAKVRNIISTEVLREGSVAQ